MGPMEKRSSERSRRRRDSTSRERRRRSSHYKSRDRRSDSPKMWPNKKVKEEVNSDAESPVHLNHSTSSEESPAKRSRRDCSSERRARSPADRDSRRSDRGRSPVSNRRYHSRCVSSRGKERNTAYRRFSPEGRDNRNNGREKDRRDYRRREDRDRGKRRDEDRRDKLDERPKKIKREHRSESPENFLGLNDDGKDYGLERKVKHEHDDDNQAPKESQLMKGKNRWGKYDAWEDDNIKKNEEPIEKEKVNLGVSGKLAEDTNTFRGVVIKYNEPPEAKKPIVRWRLYPFKGDEALPVLHIHRQSAYLIGRDRKIADLPVDHPSCSKQHAVLQFRSMPYEKSDGSKGRRVLPYIIDLGSSNGTHLNGVKIEPQRYVELQEKDVLKFGFSSREFVVLNERSACDESDQEIDSERSS